MVSQPDMFGGVSRAKEKTLKDPVRMTVNVLAQTDMAILVDHERAFAMTWVPLSLCDWGGDLGKQDMDMEKKKVRALGWLD
ncbi:MAG: hypothetical protein RLN89_03445 [Parvibaculum sp.]